MNTTTLARSFVSVAALAATLFSFAACSATVVQGGDDTDTNSAQIKGGNGPKKSTAMAMLYSELPEVSDGDSGGTSGSSGGGEPGIDPNTLYIYLSSQGMVCSDPHATLECGNQWRVSIGIPPELQKVGIIPLSTPGLIAFATSTGADHGDGTCSWGGGSFLDGTLEITAIDDTHVAGVLADTWGVDFDADGAFDAALCQF
ncbi:hypothetical protein [Polyangium aurulentum]|uniref:hypothetical protein n=1 Tax=Polyangium aurulentum TaxID=2567896 RepID=UPI0010AE5D46|nr:hypothetical protein [Polyangium aurulentum]UQA63000.1 hypothetical protein E8A73_022095 [Polyangium aurulentum]